MDELKAEILYHIHSNWGEISKSHSASLQIIKDIEAQCKNARTPELPDLNDEVRDILGRPNFTCINIAKRLREKGHEIKCKAEDEQAAVIYWMLSMYVKHGKQWKEEGEAYLKAVQTGKPAPRDGE